MCTVDSRLPVVPPVIEYQQTQVDETPETEPEEPSLILSCLDLPIDLLYSLIEKVRFAVVSIFELIFDFPYSIPKTALAFYEFIDDLFFGTTEMIYDIAAAVFNWTYDKLLTESCEPQLERHLMSLCEALLIGEIATCKQLLAKTEFDLQKCMRLIENRYDLPREQRVLLYVLAFREVQQRFHAISVNLRDDKDAYLEADLELCIGQKAGIQQLRKGHLGQVSEAEFLIVLNTVRALLQTNDPKDIDAQTNCDAVHHLLFYDLNPTHFRYGITKIDIPEKPAGTNLRQLITLFDSTNFTDPHKAHYQNPNNALREDHGALYNEPEAIRTYLVDYLTRFVNKVINKTAYIGTPIAGSRALDDFYNTIENALCHVVHKINAIQNEEEKIVVVTDTIIHVLRAASHCGPRIYEMAINRYKARVLQKKEQEADAVYDLAGEFRGILGESRIPPHSSETIIYYSKFIAGLGVELGIPGAHVLSAPGAAPFFSIGGTFQRRRDRKRFHALYNSHSVTSWITKEMSRDDLVTMCSHHMPATYRPALIENANALIARMRAENKSNAQIMQELDKPENGGISAGSPRQTPEQAVRAWKKGMYLQEEATYIDEKGKYKVKSQAILEALVHAKVLHRIG